MNERSKPIAVVAVLLFVVYTLGWFVTWLARHHHSLQDTVGVIEIALIGIIVATVMFRWAPHSPLVEVIPRLLAAIAIGCAASVLLSPFAGGSYPFKGGAGDFFLKIWIFLGVSLVGMLFGYVALVAVGRDYRAQALKGMEQARPSASTRAATPARAGASRAKQKPASTRPGSSASQ